MRLSGTRAYFTWKTPRNSRNVTTCKVSATLPVTGVQVCSLQQSENGASEGQRVGTPARRCSVRHCRSNQAQRTRRLGCGSSRARKLNYRSVCTSLTQKQLSLIRLSDHSILMLRGFFENSLQINPVAALDYYERAIEIIEWGRQVCRNVSKDDRGVIFEATFLRGVKSLRLDAAMKVWRKCRISHSLTYLSIARHM